MPRRRVELNRKQKGLLYACTGALWVTGAVWLAVNKILDRPPVPFWMQCHGAAAMFFLILFGAMLQQHVPAGWQENTKRSSGSPMVAACVFLAITGWGLYYLGNESLRQWTSNLHGGVGLILPVVLVIHILHKR